MGMARPNFVEITFAGDSKPVKFVKLFSLKSFPLYGINNLVQFWSARLLSYLQIMLLNSAGFYTGFRGEIMASSNIFKFLSEICLYELCESSAGGINLYCINFLSHHTFYRTIHYYA